jgi:hypothetical protein
MRVDYLRAVLNSRYGESKTLAGAIFIRIVRFNRFAIDCFTEFLDKELIINQYKYGFEGCKSVSIFAIAARFFSDLYLDTTE